ncbi:hypothetical protein [Hoylesella timonensis]|uniref:Uncharacterized protein n=1 Tax=Hoylesella timonensis S9-PR14 TaxID=1401062 RepID=A0A098YSD8_9BACT|nr:hypothetical protein [Hoylesella timonensis]KGI22304.1 hypothetical protein HMPREF9304_05150 [Hoylesella timonensis S9-PR14]
MEKGEKTTHLKGYLPLSNIIIFSISQMPNFEKIGHFRPFTRYKNMHRSSRSIDKNVWLPERELFF